MKRSAMLAAVADDCDERAKWDITVEEARVHLRAARDILWNEALKAAREEGRKMMTTKRKTPQPERTP